MTILRCVETSYYNTTEWRTTQQMWYWSSLVFVAFFLILLLFGIIPLFKYWKEFKSLSPINISARVCFIIGIFLKLMSHMLVFVPWLSFCEEKVIPIIGYFLFSFPSYFITTCYTLVLISWMQICLQIMPLKIANIFKQAKICLIIYNIIIYLFFIIGFIFECVMSIEQDKEKYHSLNFVSGFFDIVRDLVLFLVFTCFIFLLHKGIGNDLFAENSLEQKRLFKLVIFLAVLMLTRGIISLSQVFINTKQECGITFFVAICINEILIEGLPLFILLNINNDFLNSQRKMLYDLGTGSLLSEN